MREASERLAAIIARGRRLVAWLAQHEAAIGAAFEQQCFPEGVTVPLTFAEVMRAGTRTLVRAGDAMVKADIAHGRAMAKLHPGAQRNSVISQDVAERLAKQARMEEIVRAHAEEASQAIEASYFPDGHPPWTSMEDLLRALRVAVDARLDSAVAEEDEEDEEDEGRADARVREIASMVNAWCQTVSGFCETCGEDTLAEQVEALRSPEDDES